MHIPYLTYYCTYYCRHTDIPHNIQYHMQTRDGRMDDMTRRQLGGGKSAKAQKRKRAKGRFYSLLWMGMGEFVQARRDGIGSSSIQPGKSKVIHRSTIDGVVPRCGPLPPIFPIFFPSFAVLMYISTFVPSYYFLLQAKFVSLSPLSLSSPSLFHPLYFY
ncbi:hypothetical protein F4820DRAFT_430770 [Hypoxylon rubiginosum]|uniref:Uncharacterized protein n=1 Tax=Hypoxylon rubiginosum TaxID=110542 RepID=A0ACB9YSD7_9PEZI|nr:hypothetical protein F4820DRAFT_430770 [Hypoxylon rubiginosum]